MMISKAIDGSFDRFRKIRVGIITPPGINTETGEVNVKWLDGDVGGQSQILISYPAFNNLDQIPWGIEYGYSEGMMCVFGFLTSNRAVILTTLISNQNISDLQNNKLGVGYNKTEKIKSGEFRFTSKFKGRLYLDLAGNVLLHTPTNSILLNQTGKQIVLDDMGVSITMSSPTPSTASLTINAPNSSQVIIDNTGITVNGQNVKVNATSTVDVESSGTVVINSSSNTTINSGEPLAFKSSLERLDTKVNTLTTKFDTHVHIGTKPGQPTEMSGVPNPAFIVPITPIAPTGTVKTSAG